MITVRFPTGFSIQYNDGRYVTRDASGYCRILDKKDGAIIAQVPTAGCVLEFVTRAACAGEFMCEELGLQERLAA